MVHHTGRYSKILGVTLCIALVLLGMQTPISSAEPAQTPSRSTTMPNVTAAPSASPLPTFVDTTVADFGLGTSDGNVYIAQTIDGELILTPTVGAEFYGSTLPDGWSSAPWGVGGAATVSGGWLIVDGALANTTGTYGPGHTLEFSATFDTAAAFQHVGVAVDLNYSFAFALFSTRSGGILSARTGNSGGEETPSDLDSGYLGAPQRYRIDWTATSVNFFINDALVAEHTTRIPTTNDLQVVVSDGAVGGASLPVDWIRMGPYAETGTFTSRMFDAGAIATWTTLTSAITTPINTEVSFNTCTNNDGSACSSWQPVVGTTIGSPAGRYLWYQALLTTTDTWVTPEVGRVTLDIQSEDHTWNGNADSNWNDAGNWTPASVPAAFDNVTIPSSASNWPTVNTDSTVHDLTIQAGGQITISSPLTITGVVANNGWMHETRAADTVGDAVAFVHLTDNLNHDKYFGVIVTPTVASLGNIAVTIQGNQPCGNTGSLPQTILRCYQLVPDNPGNEAVIQFYYTAAEANGNAAPVAFLWDTDVLTWTVLSDSSHGGGGEALWVLGTTDHFSSFALKDNPAPTAIMVSSLQAIGYTPAVLLVSLVLIVATVAFGVWRRRRHYGQ